MKTLQHFFYPCILSLVFLISMAAIEGCAKNNVGDNNTSASVLLDSVISDNGGWPFICIKYIYDNQERVIEERVSHNDTLRNRRTYEYQGSSMLPYKMNSYKGTSTAPEFVSDFLYNAAGQKIYDSTYAMPGSVFTGNMSVRLDYSVAGKIIVKQEQHPSYDRYNDTIFLNNGNIDSARTHFYTKWIFAPYTNRLNVFKNLSISSCRFYSPAPNYPGQMFTGLFYSNLEDIIPLEYFSTNDYGTATAIFGTPSSSSVTQYDYQYNSSNFPVSLKKTTTAPGYLSVSQTRFVYK
jgi:hypothetical protein